MGDTKGLQDLSHEDMEQEKRRSLSSLDDIVIDTKLPADKRMEKYLKEVGNPYCFLCGDTVVHVCFSDTGKDLDTHLLNFFKTLKNG